MLLQGTIPMKEEQKKAAGGEREAELWDAIAAFERVLEVIPDDRTALGTLVDAYTRLGDFTRARQYLRRLAQAIAQERDREAAQALLHDLDAGDATDPALAEIRELLIPLTLTETALAGEGKPQASSPVAVHRPQIANEMALAWDLHQAGLLTAEQYSQAVQDLTDLFSNTTDQGLISAIHVIETRGLGRMEEILAFLARKTEMPFVRLSDFEPNEEATSLIPLETMKMAGVFPFERLESDLLVVVQNPYDRELLAWVSRVTGAACHFYLTSPQEFVTALDRLSQKAKEAAKKP